MREGKRWETTPLDIARELPKKAYLIARVNGDLWDMSRPLEGYCELKVFAFEDDEGRDTFWHSSAHILGQVWNRLLFVFLRHICLGGWLYEIVSP